MGVDFGSEGSFPEVADLEGMEGSATGTTLMQKLKSTEEWKKEGVRS